MKKFFLTIAIAFIGVSAFAQNPEGFFPGWNFGIKGGTALTAGEVDFQDLLSPRAAINAGYQFTPVFGLRGEFAAWEGKGALPLTSDLYKYNMGQIDLDALFDLCNLFGKYKYNRTINPYLFAGLGFNTRFNNDEAQAVAAHFPADNYLWDDPVLSFTGRVGLGTDIRLSNAVAITLELADNILSDHFNSKVGDSEMFGNTVDFDYQLTALAGLKFSFGAAGKRAAALAAAEAAAEAAAKAAAEAAAARAAAEKAAAEKAAAERAAAEKAAAERAAAEKAAAEAARAAARATVEDIYFTINKSVINPSEVAKIDHIIAVMNQYPEAVVSITGYADKFTGTAKRNLVLSEERAAVVCQALVDAGIAADRISTNFYGDTKQVSEVPEENRVSICVTR